MICERRWPTSIAERLGNYADELCYELADAVLALPEIAEALAFTDKFRASGYNVSTTPLA